MIMSAPLSTRRVRFVQSGAACRDQVREARRPREKEGIDRPWMTIEQSTMNATIGWMVTASSLVCALFKFSCSTPEARVDIKIAPAKDVNGD